MSAAEVAQIRLVSIGKRYSGTKALDNVSVEVAGGSVHALVGANGAGKSTLGKIVGGVIRPDDGQLFVDEREVRYSSPREARIDGIATIAEAIKLAGKDEPKAIQDALWKVSFTGVNGPIKFEKDGPAGKESGQSKPSIFVVQVRDGKVALPDFMKK